MLIIHHGIMLILKLLLFLIFIYLAASIGYLLVVAIAGRLGNLPVYGVNTVKNNIAVIIPAYREDAVIVNTARNASAHNYPADKYRVIVVADKLQPDTLLQLRLLPVTVLEVDLNMKSRSVNAGLQYLDGQYFDIAVVLDADNIMDSHCLEKINDAFQRGCHAVQCHRTAKNQHTAVALLDAISEEININLFRRGPAVLGISAAPIGSGMAFAYNLLKEIFSTAPILNNPGEDREIDMELMKRRIFMHFIEDAYVFDEKVADSGVFEKQRVRWLEAQVNHVKRFFDADMKTAPRTATYFCKFFQNLILPRLLLIMALGLVFLLLLFQSFFSFQLMYPTAIYWYSIIVAYTAVLILSVPGRFYKLSTVKAVLQIPALMLAMLKAIFKMKAGRKEFLHTPKAFKS